jgi:hypothetical protein
MHLLLAGGPPEPTIIKPPWLAQVWLCGVIGVGEVPDVALRMLEHCAKGAHAREGRLHEGIPLPASGLPLVTVRLAATCKEK